MIAFACIGCAKAFSVKDELAGRRTKCPKCGVVLHVPSVTPVAPALPTAVPVASVPPPPTPRAKGLWGRLADKASRSLEEVTNSFQDAGRRIGGHGTGEPYQPQPDHRDLSKVVSHPTSSETYPWPPGSSLRLILTPDEFFFVECPLLGPPTVPLRLPHVHLLLVRREWVAVADLGQAFLDGWRYSEKDLRMLRAVEKPREAPCLCIMYHDETKYDKRRLFMGLEGDAAGMSLDETAYHLDQLIQSRRAKEAEAASQSATRELLEPLEGLRSAALAQQDELLKRRDELAAERAESRKRMAELREKIDRAKAAKASPAKVAEPSLPDPAASVAGAAILAQIEQLGQLRDKGLLTEQEFQAKKQELLARV